LYCIGLCSFWIVGRIAGDRWWWLFLLKSFTPHYFLALPVLVVGVLAMRQRRALLSCAVVLGLALLIYGRLFLPTLTSSSEVVGPQLTVMTYNVVGRNDRPAAVVESIRQSEADVVALQELNSAIAEVIRRDLAVAYPFQVLEPAEGISGMGVISRHKIREARAPTGLYWVGPPQVLELQFDDRKAALVNFHAMAVTSGDPAQIALSIDAREQQAHILSELAAAHPCPLIVMGDLNATDQHEAYSIISKSLRDAWREAGFGFGHTFPGGSRRPKIFGITPPSWLIRIDYVFHSAHWHAASARIGRWDGVSDHRPVIVELRLSCPEQAP
jgi:endonuclease/exonuclease/phosphatase (EEP) superfamily protein YafD